ncbi:DNA repair protein [Moraxella caviae]|uniref:High-affinity zinc uptake system membrane protein ZnuB n=1 Tax=Moraxella caviae TaxID=34060 RepID=A0A1T0A0Z3_9GAMM|nr:metal ABC transporter permease [Moraxella caviae]OOR89259.1 DNA repair protein [Moraxella caviae]STZ13864.1 High-affinity zinc uptake system membrane protein znuB [Moraxella caviae]VEW11178.1 High-affinity zinc uptake system membrane protein znuB [Moraxella caviae]
MTDWLPIIAPAWIAGSLLALLSAPLGCLVLWRRMAFFADTLAHGTLLGVAIAAALSLPADMGVGVVSALVVLILMALKDSRLPNDATLAVMTAVLLCLGLLTLTQLTQQQANVLGYLFGSLLDLDWADLPRLAVLIALGLAFLAWIWRAQVQLATFEALAIIAGVKPRQQQLFFMGLLAGFCAVALQAVGSLLISGLLILPALTARLFSHSPTRMVIFAMILAQCGVTLGVWGSVWLDIQTGLAIVLTLACGFFITFGVQKLRRA